MEHLLEEEEASVEAELVNLRKAGAVVGRVGKRYGARMVKALEYSAEFPNGDERRMVLDEDGDIMVFASGPLVRYVTGQEDTMYSLNTSETSEIPPEIDEPYSHYFNNPGEIEDVLRGLDMENLYR